MNSRWWYDRITIIFDNMSFVMWVQSFLEGERSRIVEQDRRDPIDCGSERLHAAWLIPE